ncbi:MAG: class I tRNA ligase family protein, partial [Tepidisphaeraceae bacterium]
YDPGSSFPKDQLRKEKDIFDVWFESGSSWHSVLVGRGKMGREAVYADIERAIAAELQKQFNTADVGDFKVQFDQQTGHISVLRNGMPLDEKTVGRIAAQAVKEKLIQLVRQEQCGTTMRYPADMYLEGSDQHRGWFQLSLLPALGCTGRPPYRQVLTHGFIVKPDGTKVSKSDTKEYVTATKEIDTHGADLLRLWCCSVDYQNDIPTSPQVIREFGDKYRKIRNTLRYLLSNLYDYQPTTVRHGPTLQPVGSASADAGVPSTPCSTTDRWAVPTLQISTSSLDAWAIDQLNQLIAQVTEAYDVYQLHRAFRLLHDFCSVQISAVYGNAMKDRLYCESPAAPLRRRCQYVMHQMVLALTKLLAPMVVFTADETWEHIPHKPADEANLPSVHLALLPKPLPLEIPAETRRQWELLMTLRETGLMQLDGIKKAAGMNKALDAEIVYTVKSEQEKSWLSAYGDDLEDMLGAGFHSIVVDPSAAAISIQAIDRRDKYPACARSWKRRPDVGQDPAHPDLSLRDAAAINAGK